MGLTQRDLQHVFERLRSGVVPERGLEAFAVGIDPQRAEIQRLLSLARQGEGVFKFLRGGYGCGKTFMARIAAIEAQAQGFATSFVVVSDNDLHFHRFDELYRRVVQELATASCPRGALGDIVDRWIARVEEALVAGGADESAPDFDARVAKRMEEDLASAMKDQAPEDFARVLRVVFELKQARRVAEASALLAWLAGSQNVAAPVKKLAGVKGEVTSHVALDYLRGILCVVKAAGYAGLVIVIDEAETILRMRQDVRGKSLNGIRQICDLASSYPGLLWIFTGTPDFFDTKRGVAGLEPLHGRIKFTSYEGGTASLRQPQMRLKPFDRARLKEVALKLRGLYPHGERLQLESRAKPEVIDRLIERVSAGFAGDVGVVPRQFLRQLVDLLDTIVENPEFDPTADPAFAPAPVKEPNETELRLVDGKKEYDPEPDDERGYPVLAPVEI